MACPPARGAQGPTSAAQQQLAPKWRARIRLRWSAARASYERLFALGKDARQPDDDLGYAFALARLGDGSADAAFQHAVTTANGPVARCRYAQYLDESGRRREARELYDQVVKEGRLAPAHTRDLHKAWYRLAADALKAP